ncbi:aldose epimerase family protein [Anditalea andensis]|nr:aldose epimerase family protein [Anditalea andensis]
MGKSLLWICCISLSCMVLSSSNEKSGESDAQDPFTATVDGKEVAIYKLKNDKGMEIHVLNYGGRVVKIMVPDREGSIDDVVLGFDRLEDYQESSEAYFGAVIGRYGNRIAKGSFSLDGTSYALAINNEPNALHGGPAGFHHVVWEVLEHHDDHIAMKYIAKDGEEGYPGNMEIFMTYTLTDDNGFRIDYEATTDKKTVVNLTHHSFFNLNGAGSGDVMDHILELNASAFTPVDKTLIPVGTILPVANTPMDFTRPTAIGERIGEGDEQLTFGRGYDHNWVLDKAEPGLLTFAAAITAPASGRKMEVFTTEPGIQFYSGNFLNGSVSGKDGKNYIHRSAFCLETQHFPDSPNQETFPSTVLSPGEKYTHTVIYQFSVLADTR